MKKLLILAIFAFVTIEVNAQKMTADKVPSAVKESFAKQYPTVKTAKWGKEDADYEASFKMDGKDMSVVLDGKGVEKEVETDIKFSELPMPVQTALKGKKVKEAAIIKKGGKTLYEAEVGGKDLLFDADGKMMKM
ncbi:MAG: hypothetical protein V4585_02165 [Bacteroidota bacterium]